MKCPHKGEQEEIKAALRGDPHVQHPRTLQTAFIRAMMRRGEYTPQLVEYAAAISDDQPAKAALLAYARDYQAAIEGAQRNTPEPFLLAVRNHKEPMLRDLLQNEAIYTLLRTLRFAAQTARAPEIRKNARTALTAIGPALAFRGRGRDEEVEEVKQDVKQEAQQAKKSRYRSKQRALRVYEQARKELGDHESAVEVTLTYFDDAAKPHFKSRDHANRARSGITRALGKRAATPRPKARRTSSVPVYEK